MDLPLTPERVVLDYQGISEEMRANAARRGQSEANLQLGLDRIIMQHQQRYFFAERLLAQRNGPLTILDAACGTGYGTYILAGRGQQTERTAIGVDIDSDAIAHAGAHFAAPDGATTFLQADCLALPWSAPTFDLIASFETLEYFTQADGARFVASLARLLKPDGLLVISSPPPPPQLDAAPATPFHLHEYTLDEFAAVLGAHFAHVRLFEQGYIAGYAILPAALSEASPPAATARETLQQRTPLRPRPIFFPPPGGVAPPPALRNHIAVCGHDLLPALIEPSIFCFDPQAPAPTARD